AISIGLNSLGTVTFSPATARVGETVAITVTGDSPCGAVDLNFGDGQHVTYAITGLPTTQTHRWTVAGTLQVQATGHGGNCSGVIDVPITIAGNPGPIVTLDSPAADARFIFPQTTDLRASASDVDGINRVEFYNGYTLLGSATSAPYQISWTPPVGTPVIHAVAYDALGIPTDSAPVQITVTHLASVTIAPSSV